ncbi:MAG: hypothetical protein ACI3VQ_06380 [Faecousia sp.]
MERVNELPKKILAGLKKYKYAVLVLLLGIALMLLPFGKKEETTETEVQVETLSDEAYAQALEQRLEDMLCQVSGAGQVRVMLTLQTGSRTEYQTDTQISDSETQSQEERKTVILSEGSAYDKAAVSAVQYPRFQGALILCQGADQSTVRLSLVNAVAALTGLSSGQITVIKMK